MSMGACDGDMLGGMEGEAVGIALGARDVDG